MKQIIKYTAAWLFLGMISCKKDFLETRPTNAVTEQEIFSTYNSINSALGGVYKELFAYGTGVSVTQHEAYGQKSFDLASDLMGSDIVMHSLGYNWYNTNYQYTEWTRDVQNRQSDMAWYYYYDIIKQVNTIIANVDGVAGATTAQKESIKGQALGLRAYAYFYLVNYFQQTYKGNETKPGVPVYTAASTIGKPRGTVQQVYDQLLSDLNAAETLLAGKGRADKTAIDVSVVQGFKARTYLLMENWAQAAASANAARQGYSLMTVPQYLARGAFSQISNPEWMWGSFIPAAEATLYASFFSHMDIAMNGYATLGQQKKITKALYDQIAAGDVRKARFKAPGTGTTADPDYNQHKFEVPVVGSWAADYVYMRVAEMYLIEAEALARQGQDASARTVLETLIKARYPAYTAASLSGTALLNEILLQRRIELWGEGFALMDVKRLKNGLNRPAGTGNHGAPSLDPIVYTLPDGTGKFLMRIPKRELDANESMTAADQNPVN